ncbi:50S ribosomal protein L15 [Sandarakinorhabdus cyanobacteriorum]|uniref:Large ribosomal subunit protein uL15 n=1 Tax=Sandarakinorhabdus cyanobacteriorum TaxID=1981098 RepID=A0A255YF02_9SPHN|nr:50S ribosomal protein L15 [Sandarakinorhabdus cyanobacteriorum]OYQ27789.1 50S ribosomal protein L15 [Sandarakinorhabdus cyanobacteriorum]
MTKLNDLHDNPGARKKRVRVGRGIGSGVGKTAGRGQKGQTSRSGVAINGFEGGQMPLHMRLPKRGFNNIFRKDYAVLNLGTLQSAIDAGRLDAGSLIDADALVAAKIITNARDGVRLLGVGELTAKVTLKLAGASATANAAVEAAGGSIELPAPAPAPLSREEQKAARAAARAAKAPK